MFLRIVGARSAEQFDIIEVKTCAIILTCITYYIYVYHDFWEHLASNNGADVHKYNTLYTRTLN